VFVTQGGAAKNVFTWGDTYSGTVFSFVATSFTSISIDSGAQTSEIMGSGTMTQGNSQTYTCTFDFQAPDNFALYNSGAKVAWTVHFSCGSNWSGTKVPTSTPTGAGISIAEGTSASCGNSKPPPPLPQRVGVIPPPPAHASPPPPRAAPPPPATCLLISTVPTTGSTSSVYTWAGDWYPGTSTTSAGTATGTLYLSLSNNGGANPSSALVYTDTYGGVNYQLTANSFSSIAAADTNDVITISGPGTLTVAGYWTAQCSFTLSAADSGVQLGGKTYSFTMYFNCGSWFTGTKAGVQGSGANINVVPGSGPACGNAGTARPPPPAKMAPPPPATCATSTGTTPGREFHSLFLADLMHVFTHVLDLVLVLHTLAESFIPAQRPRPASSGAPTQTLHTVPRRAVQLVPVRDGRHPGLRHWHRHQLVRLPVPERQLRTLRSRRRPLPRCAPRLAYCVWIPLKLCAAVVHCLASNALSGMYHTELNFVCCLRQARHIRRLRPWPTWTMR